MRYARNTYVRPDRSRAEIERTLSAYGASQFAYGWSQGRAMIGFHYQGRSIRFVLDLPTEDTVSKTPTGRTRRNMDKALTDETMQAWRVLALGIKAKLAMIEGGVTTFDNEFEAYIVLPSGQTVGEWMRPQIDRMVETGKMPKTLLLEAPDSDG